MFNEYLSIGKVAQYLGVSISTLRRWDKSKNLISSFRTSGNHRRYKKTDLMLISKENESNEDKSYEQEFCEYICAIMTVFSSKLYSKRSHKNKKSINSTSKLNIACIS